MHLQNKTTPMMTQWHTCKNKAKGALLFFRLGDFYEAFYKDAELISKELDLTLTKRQQVPMCGVPFHSAEQYIDRLIAKGYKVAIAEQTEDPKKVKGLVRREIVRILSPATVVNSSLLTEKSNNFFASIVQIGKTFGIAIIDLTTGEFCLSELEEQKDLINEIYRLRPKEFLISKKLKTDHCSLFEELSHHFAFLLNTKEEWYFDFKMANELLCSHFQVHSLDSFGIQGMTAAISAAGALFCFLQEDLHIDLKHIRTIQNDSVSSFMSIDHSCLKNLEIFQSSEKNFSLLSLIDKTNTAMGGRMLNRWLRHPLLSCIEIQKRQDAIEELLNNYDQTTRLQSFLSQIKDIERLIMKISSGFANPRDLISLKNSLLPIPEIKKLLSSFQSSLLKEDAASLKETQYITKKIQEAIVEEPPLRISDGGTIRRGYNKELDEFRSINTDSKTWIANYQNRLREEMQIKTLKVGFTKVFGYFIEVSKGQANKIPQDFHRRQTLFNSERFITDELQYFEQKILTAQEKILALEDFLFQQIREQIAQFLDDIFLFAKAIARIDCLISLCEIAREYHYKRPFVDESTSLEIREGRHPILERSLFQEKFIPNDTVMNEDNQLFLITGPNMSGKSTYIRQVALIVILAQIGSFIPVSSARIGLVDKVFSRIGASDDISKGKSTFMVEMSETANILHNATSRSLIILDEIGRGTSTYDGISIAWAVAEYLLTTQEKKAKTLFATHYWELTELENRLKGIVNYQVAVKETKEGIVFLHKIIKGGTDKSYGIHVARLAGLPYSVIKKAEEMLVLLEKKANRKSPSSDLSIPPLSEQLALFSPSKKLQEFNEELLKIQIDDITPLQAIAKLYAIQKKAHDLIQEF